MTFQTITVGLNAQSTFGKNLGPHDLADHFTQSLRNVTEYVNYLVRLNR
jgi:hypothetical protein